MNSNDIEFKGIADGVNSSAAQVVTAPVQHVQPSTTTITTHTCSKEHEMGKMRGDIQAIFKRMDEQQQLSKTIYRVEGVIEKLAALQEIQTKTMEKMDTRMEKMDTRSLNTEKEMRKMSEDMKEYSDLRNNELHSRLRKLEDKDGNAWRSAKSKIATAFISGLVGAIITVVGMVLAATLL